MPDSSCDRDAACAGSPVLARSCRRLQRSFAGRCGGSVGRGRPLWLLSSAQNSWETRSLARTLDRRAHFTVLLAGELRLPDAGPTLVNDNGTVTHKLCESR
jgi:hypothetical protein